MPVHYINNAHNDYLEIVLETGLAGVLAILGYVAALILSLVRGGERARERLPAVLGIAVLLAHSIGDYPMRTPTLMTVFGLLSGLAFNHVRSPARVARRTVPQ